MEIIKSFLTALPSAASSPLAFVGYIFLIGAWIAISFRVTRNRHLLTNLEKLPPADRLAALEIEMGSVRLKEGLTAEEWIRSRIHLYYFLGFSTLCVVAVMIFGIAAVKAGEVHADVSLHQSPTAMTPVIPAGTVRPPSSDVGGGVQGATDVAQPPASARAEALHLVRHLGVSKGFSDSGGRAPYATDDFTVSYVFERNEDGIVIRPTAPYFETLRRGGPVKGQDFWWSPFAWQFPELSAEVVNNTKSTLFLNELVIEVIRSDVDLEPVLLIEENFYNVGKFAILNEGWGAAEQAVVDFDILPRNECDNEPTLVGRHRLAVGSVSDDTNVNIVNFVPESLKDERVVCIAGKLDYKNNAGQGRTLRFSTRVSLVMPGPGMPAPPSYLYDVFLEAGYLFTA